MSVFDDAARLVRLGLALRLRDGSLAPVAAAAAASSGGLLVGASAHANRLDVVMPYHDKALAAVAPHLAAPTADQDLQLLIRVDGDAVAVAIARRGSLTPREAIDELAFGSTVNEPWLDLVEQLCSVEHAKILGRTRFLTESRAQLAIRYPKRDRESDNMVMLAIDQLAEDIGITAAQRKLWLRVHPELGRGSEISITTGCNSKGMSPYFGIAYPIDRWEVALRLAQGVVFNDSAVKEVATRLGELAGALDSKVLESVELVLGPNEPPDVVVWVRLAPGA